MPEQEGLRKYMVEDFESGKPFVDLDWEDIGFTSPPEGWEGRTGKLMYLKHVPCGRIFGLAAGIVGPREIKNVIDNHSGSCRKEATKTV